MDIFVQKALLAKAKKVFTTQRTFLSFPLTPITFNQSDLSSVIEENALTNESINHQENFAQLVNLIPNGEFWQPNSGQFLWDEYESILNQAILLDSSRTNAEEAQYQQARGVLWLTSESGEYSDSEKFTRYKEFKDEYIVLQEKFNEEQISAELSDDIDYKEDWFKHMAPAYRDKLATLESQWLKIGFKEEVGRAKSIISVLGAKSPFTTWSEWQEKFDPELNSRTNPATLSTSFVTRFFPHNAIDDDNWSKFNLTGAELKKLSGEATNSQGGNKVNNISLEISSAAVERPWFTEDIFKARFWYFQDSKKLLSDGENPPSGECPAYVCAVIFAKNIQVSYEKSQTAKTIKPPLKLFDFRQLETSNLLKHSKLHIKTAQPKTSSPKLSQAMLSKFSTIKTKKLITPIKRTSLKATAFKKFKFKPLKRAKMTTLAPIKPAKQIENSTKSSSYVESTGEDTIYVLAFVCKPLPKCPDPVA